MGGVALLVKGNVYSPAGIAHSLKFRLVLSGSGSAPYRHSLRLGIGHGLRLVFKPLMIFGPGDDLACGLIKRGQQEVNKRNQQQRERPIHAENSLKAKGQKACDNAAEGQLCPVVIKQRHHGRKAAGRSKIRSAEKKIRHGAEQHRQQKGSGKSERHGSAFVEEHDVRADEHHRREDIEAPAHNAAYDLADEVNEQRVNAEIRYQGKKADKGQHAAGDLPADGLLRRGFCGSRPAGWLSFLRGLPCAASAVFPVCLSGTLCHVFFVPFSGMDDDYIIVRTMASTPTTQQ